MKTIEELRNELTILRKRKKSWGEIASIFFPKDNDLRKKMRPILYRILLDNYEPQDNELRTLIGLARVKTVTACPVCNEVHIARCPELEPEDLPTPPSYGVAQRCSECGEVHAVGFCTKKYRVEKRRRNPRPPSKRPKMVSVGYLNDEDEDLVMSITPTERLQAIKVYVDRKVKIE